MQVNSSEPAWFRTVSLCRWQKDFPSLGEPARSKAMRLQMDSLSAIRLAR